MSTVAGSPSAAPTPAATAATAAQACPVRSSIELPQVPAWISDEQCIAAARAIAFTAFAHPYDVIRMRMHAPTNQSFANSWECAKAMFRQDPKLFAKGSSIPLFGHALTSYCYFTLYSNFTARLVARRREHEIARYKQSRMDRMLEEQERWTRMNLWEKSSVLVVRWFEDGGFVENDRIREEQKEQREFVRLLRNADNLPFSQCLLSAGACGAVCGILSCPVDFVRSRYVTSDLFPNRKYTSVSNCIRTVSRQSGPFIFFKGLPVAMLRDGVGWPMLIGCYGNYKRYRTHRFDDRLHPGVIGFIGGAASGFVQWSVVLPIEKIKTVIQTAESRKGVTASTAIDYIYNKYGMKGFYRGLPVTLFRASVIGGLTFGSAEIYNARQTEAAVQLQRDQQERARAAAAPVTGVKMAAK